MCFYDQLSSISHYDVVSSNGARNLWLVSVVGNLKTDNVLDPYLETDCSQLACYVTCF